MKSQVKRIIESLRDGQWHCTSQYYGDHMADPRRRMKDIQEKGILLESRPCKTHNYHAGGSKEWRMVSVPPKKYTYIPSIRDGNTVMLKVEV